MASPEDCMSRYAMKQSKLKIILATAVFPQLQGISEHSISFTWE